MFQVVANVVPAYRTALVAVGFNPGNAFPDIQAAHAYAKTFISSDCYVILAGCLELADDQDPQSPHVFLPHYTGPISSKLPGGTIVGVR